MKKIYIFDKKFVFGFVKEIPAICSQGKTKEDVDININKYIKCFYEKKY